MPVIVVLAWLKLFPKRVKSRIFLTYDSEQLMDGLGSQVQRIVSIYFLAFKLGVKFKQSELKDILVVSPVDSYQTENQVNDYLPIVNNILKNLSSEKSVIENSKIEEISFVNLKLTDLVIVFIRVLLSCVRKQRIEVVCKIVAPFNIVDKLDFTPLIFESLTKQLQLIFPLTTSANTAVLHYRSGFGREITFPGESSPRFISAESFFREVNSLFDPQRGNFPNIKKLIFLTDAPASDVIFEPPKYQLDRWKGTPLESGKALITGLPDSKVQSLSRLPVTIVRGGDPLLAITIMMSANILMFSKSSFGYLGAILNQGGLIYSPRDFWHRKQRGWIEFNA